MNAYRSKVKRLAKLARSGGSARKVDELSPPDGWVVTDAHWNDPRRASTLHPSRSVARAAAESAFYSHPVVVWEKRGERYRAVWRSLEAVAPRPIDEHGSTYYPTLRRRAWK
jgi:hypothetical protein